MTDARLDAWIDFNGDGSWGGPLERVASNAAMVNGDNLLVFDVPSTAAVGTVFARFRLSTEGSLGPYGRSSTGEVEDHAVTIDPSAAAVGFAGHHVASATPDQARSLFAADVDRDGDVDLLSASTGVDTVAWYENDGSQNFTTHIISTTADGAWSVIANDVDGDGDIDVVSASFHDDSIAWYENDGSQNFTPHIIFNDADGARDVVAADLDGDGDTDVLSASTNDDTIAWFENDGSQNFEPHYISGSADGVQSIFAADVDRDGDLDVLSASAYDDKFAWYENDGSQNFVQHVISDMADTAASVSAADVDGDGDTDILGSYIDKLVWYENDGNQNFVGQTISNTSGLPFAADVDGDGDLDVLSASSSPNTVLWHQNDGSQNFHERAISEAPGGASSVLATDIDGDGDLDAISASSTDHKITWYENHSDFVFDFGDAPAPFPTTLSENGAWHAALGPMLGMNRDFEPDGTHSALADFDDLNPGSPAPDDEDGVTFGALQVGQSDAMVTVNVQGLASKAKLDAWIDFHGDGNWSTPGEKIADSLTVINGDNAIVFDVPGTATGQTVATRFRLSTQGNLGPEGSAVDGELEDHLISIEPPLEASVNFGNENIVAADPSSDIVAADIDGDGDLDLLSALYPQDRVVWYENNSQTFIKREIGIIVGARSVFAADVDGDGDTDVLSTGNYGFGEFVWFENDGNQNFARNVLAEPFFGEQVVSASDIDGDDDMDVVAGFLGAIGWFENDGQQIFTFHTISSTVNGTADVLAADLDGDGDGDILATLSTDDTVIWYENDGSQNFTSHVITSDADGANSLFVTDLDHDGDIDVLSTSFDEKQVVWYENDGNENFTSHIISAVADGANSVFAADFDHDGDTDVLAASSRDAEVVWYENDGQQHFIARTVSTSQSFARATIAADWDGDGDPDILNAASLDNRIVWYENLSTPTCDFNGDSDCDIHDIDSLVMEIVTGTHNSTFDLNDDGFVNLTDRDQWLAVAGGVNVAPGNPYFPGDTDLDGNVDGQDFAVWNSHKFTTTGKWSQADWNADGTTDGRDFLIWNTHKFQGVGPLPRPVFAEGGFYKAKGTGAKVSIPPTGEAAPAVPTYQARYDALTVDKVFGATTLLDSPQEGSPSLALLFQDLVVESLCFKRNQLYSVTSWRKELY